MGGPGRAAMLVVALAAAGARAAVYETAIVADDEDDLLSAFQRGDITETTLNLLLELLREGVELNTSSRDELYDLPGLTYQNVDAILELRKTKGRIEDPAELVAAEAITAQQLLEIAPFLRIDAARPLLPVSAKLRLVTQYTLGDTVAPPGVLLGKARGPAGLSAGFLLVTTRRTMDRPVYSPALDALETAGFGYRPALPRAWARWQSGQAQVVVGTFTAGFGERLTLDNTSRFTPRGIYVVDDFVRAADLASSCRYSSPEPGTVGCDDPADGTATGSRYITADYRHRNVFRGVAGSVEDLSLGEGSSLSLYGLLSYQTRSIYQYELYDRRTCDDARDDGASGCASPPIYGPGGLQVRSSTLPALYDELLGGAHVAFKPTPQLKLGVTGYGAVPLFNGLFTSNGPLLLDFQEWSRTPSGGPFGAVGVNAQTWVGRFVFHLETTVSFDRRAVGPEPVPVAQRPVNAGFGALQRTTYSVKGHELEFSLRFYDVNFGNPFARPAASPDEFDGVAARNEFGVRARYVGRFGKDWELKLRADFWVPPFTIRGLNDVVLVPAGTPNFFAVARVDFNGWSFFQPAVWVDYRDRNLAVFDRAADRNCDFERLNLAEGDPVLCSGDYLRATVRIDSRPLRELAFALQASTTFVDDSSTRFLEAFRPAFTAWGEVRVTPVEWLRLRLRSRYFDADVSSTDYLEQSWWTYLEATFKVPGLKGTSFAGRYDLFVWLDQRASTLARQPNPEHRFMLDLRTEL